MSIKVVVADDHEVVRKGLASLLAGSDVKIVGEASNPNEAAKVTSKQKPDVLLLDIRLGEHDGLEALDRIHRQSPNVKVVILSTYDNPTYVARAVALGASDYVLKGATRQEILSVITAAADGKSPAPAGEMARVASTMAKTTRAGDEYPLTPRETQVLRHIALGLSNKEIGRSLAISIETVKEHVQNILRKITVTDRTQAAVWAVKRGLV